MFDQSENGFLEFKRGALVRCSIHLGSLVLAFLLCACNPDPFPGTPEDLARYGVVPGRAADVEVRGVHFRIPAQFPILLNSDSWIRKGHAYALTFSLDISKAVEGTGDVGPGDALFNVTRKSDVMVHVLSGTSELSKETVPDKSLAPGSEDYYGLRFSRSNLSWRSIEERTRKGNPIIIFCTPCRSTFDYDDAVRIEYYFRDSELPHWKLIYESVLKTVQQFTGVDGSK